MSTSWIPGHKAQLAILKAFAQFIKRAIGLFEPTNDDEIWETLPFEEFESYCRKIYEFSEGKRLCQKDHIERARRVMESGVEELTLCHAGVFNQALPIIVDGDVKAVLMYGQLWAVGNDCCAEARERHERTIARLRQTENDELELRVYYDEIKRFSANDLDTLNQQLSLLQHSYYEMLSEEQARIKQADGIIHELQIRLQPILAEAENLYYDLRRTSIECPAVESLSPVAKELLNSVLMLRTLVRNFGNFMPEDYQFKTCSVGGLIERAITVYGSEAKRKRVAISPQLEGLPKVELSRDHLQEAINNLVHNAIKYSFSGASDHYRYVEIDGEVVKSDYKLTFSNYGVGILPEELDRIFEPGYKGELTRKEYRSGAGMGLAIAKEIIERHQGTIEARSVKTDGDAYVNTFIVRLPLEQAKGEKYEDCMD